MAYRTIGIIGGTGLSDVLSQVADAAPVEITTPFGSPSAPPLRARWHGVDVLFIPRHGIGHRFNPTNVPYRANIWALKALGAEAVLASGATGSLREDVEPGHIVLCDQVIDRTSQRMGTFFDNEVVAHVEMAEPFCPYLRSYLAAAGHHIETTVHHAGTYVCMEGPQFSTRAESEMHRQWGGDLIGMTCMPEARLAREAELCYALVALPTDYDCWRPVGDGVPKSALLEEIKRNLRRASDAATSLIQAVLPALAGAAEGTCTCRRSLNLAIWSDRNLIDERMRQRLHPILKRWLDKSE